jgi:LysM repeat protein
MRRRRSPARWLAPLAIIACAVSVYSVVNTGLGAEDPATTRSSTTATSAGKTRTIADGGSPKRGRPARTYTVKPGDTLSAIAVSTGVSLARLQELNPELDSQSLQTGQRVKLSP